MLRKLEKELGGRLTPEQRAAIEVILRDVNWNADPADFDES